MLLSDVRIPIVVGAIALTGCTAIANFDSYQQGDGGNGGTGATGGMAGAGGGDAGMGGMGGNGGDGGSMPSCTANDAYTLETDSLVPIQDACALGGNQVVITGAQNEVELAPNFDPTVPFPFCFYGEAIEGIWVGDNGYVGLGVQAPEALLTDVGNPHALDLAGLPQPGVLPFWDALRVGTSGVCVAIAEEEPDRILWVTWKEACFDQGVPCTGSSSLTFSVGIEETSNRIYMGYPAMSGSAGVLEDRASGQTATVGIVNTGMPGCAATECGADGLCGGGEPCGYTQYSAQAITTLQTLEFTPNAN